ncbi:MAG: cytochrome c [Candidatus Kapabacteria bacterium]|nr:cytochrome c [Candidatus Kapabacteria bacterium]
MKRNTALFLILVAIFVSVTGRSVENRPQPDRGREVYSEYCQRCHGIDGAGGKGLYNISERKIWQQSPREIIRVVAFGASGKNNYGQPGLRFGMPPAPYTDKDLAAVSVYAMKVIGKRDVVISAEDVSQLKMKHIQELRKRLER